MQMKWSSECHDRSEAPKNPKNRVSVLPLNPTVIFGHFGRSQSRVFRSGSSFIGEVSNWTWFPVASSPALHVNDIRSSRRRGIGKLF